MTTSVYPLHARMVYNEVMRNEDALEDIKTFLRKNPRDMVAYSDMTDLLRAWGREDLYTALEKADEVLFIQNVGMKLSAQEERYENAELLRKQIYRTLLFSAPHRFEHFLQALEYERKPEERFYLPRRKVLRQHVKALQDLEEGKLDELFISMPPRTGKSTVVLFYLTWVMGRDSEGSNLYCSVTDDLTKTFCKRVLEILTDHRTYLYKEIFPDAKIVDKNMDKETIDITRIKGYPTLTCRSLYGSLNGSCDARHLLIADDLLTGIEEARNPTRLKTAQTTVDNNLLSRAKESCRLLWIGTRWSLQDPIGNRIRALESDVSFKGLNYKVINIPALDLKDKSNFEYDYGVGFSTDFYRRKRAIFEQNNDLASWDAQFMGLPIEREQSVFTPDTMRMFNGTLPEKVPDRVWAVCDPAFGGGDFVSAPIICSYGKMDNYVVDVVYSNRDTAVTIPMLAKKLKEWVVSSIDIEITRTTRSFAEKLEEELQKIGYHCTITTHVAPQDKAKELRIYDKAPDIRQYLIFLDTGHRTKQYNQFMQNVYSFTVQGKNLHDDAPDSLSMAISRMFAVQSARATVIQRPF